MKSLKSITLGIGAAIVLAAGTASAERPLNLANTTWTLQANGTVEQLVINTQGGPGAPGAADCRHIQGEIGNVAEIRGWYCQATGRIHFVHENADSLHGAGLHRQRLGRDLRSALAHGGHDDRAHLRVRRSRRVQLLSEQLTERSAVMVGGPHVG
jgi:hypothetical protein